MYISKVHLQGFKSFLNKTDLQFGHGITCVVGPNGCGKTNIVDSIRWILGEQKSSVLRSNKMEDVIFNGTRKRKSVSFCEASIMLHNEGRLPVEYTDIEITRRLFRSGESEYLMNKVPCRLKDINNLFMDTGMGAGAYSVIELKMIESILSQNTAERKHLIEEAAGINQYKQQRQQTFRKLNATKSDLERVNDILIELDKNVKGLALQLKRFERHAKLTEQLKNKSILMAGYKYNLLNSQISPVSEEMDFKKSTYSKLSSQMNMDEELEKSTQKRYDDARSEMETLELNLADTVKKLTEKNKNIIIWTENKKSNEGRIQQNSDDSVQMENQKNILNEQIIDLNKTLKEIEPEIHNRKKSYENEVHVYEELKTESEQQINKYKIKQSEFDVHLNMIFQEETTFKLNENSLESHEELVKTLQTRRTEMKSREMNSLEGISDLKKMIGKKEESANNQLIEIENLKKTQLNINSDLIYVIDSISEINLENERINSKINLFENILKSRGDSASGLNFIEKNKEKFKGLLGILSDLIEIPEEYHKASEVILGDLKNAVIVENFEIAKLIIDELKKNDGGALTLISLDKIPIIKSKVKSAFVKQIKSKEKLNDLVNHLFNDVLIVDSISEINKKSPLIVTKDGDFLKNGYEIKSSSLKNKVSVLGKKKEMNEMKKQINLNLIRLESQESKRQDLESKLNDINNKATSLETSFEIIVSDKQKLEIELSGKEAGQIHLQEIKNENRKEIDKSIIQIESFKLKIEKCKDEVKKLIEEKVLLTEKIGKITQQTENYRQKTVKQQELTQQKQLHLIESEKEKSTIEFRLNSIEDRIAENQRRIDRIKSINIQLRKSNDDLDKKLSLENELKSELLEEQEKLGAQKGKTDKEYNDAYQELKELQQNMRSHHKLKEDRIFEIQEMELKISNLKNEQLIVTDKIYEKFGVTIEELKTIDVSELNNENLLEETLTLEKSLERIGPINMAIQDEYEKESERLTFLKEQVTDLVEAEKTLVEAIQKIDKDARDQFLDTFNEVAVNFKSTFKRFFDGGEAEIKLEKDIDPLEADIEIIAKPPGKRTQSLKMLSAGEKALTAISLLFAIYLVKPSPFCILDEVDAPLDDRNIKKYTKVLREFAEKTQFIVITHNKLTMESADYLYGVTQEEEGVSKIVSVKFKENNDFQFA